MRLWLKNGWWLTAILLLAVTRPVTAHSNLVASSPAQDERLSESPTTIFLLFDAELAEAASGFQLLTANGQPVAGVAGQVDLSDPEHQRLIAKVGSSLAGGVYTVRWKAVSTDGDGALTEGEFDFMVGNAAPRVKPAVTATSATAPASVSGPTTTPPNAESAGPVSEVAWPLVIVGGVVVILALMALGLREGRRS